MSEAPLPTTVATQHGVGSRPTTLPPVLVDATFAASGLAHAFAERSGGVSAPPFASLNLGPRSGDDPDAVRENRRRFLTAAGVERLVVMAPPQVHSADVMAVAADDAVIGQGVLPGDGIVTDRRGVALMVLAADCVPVLLHDPVRQVIGAVHAGWRGTAGAIARNAVALMRERFGCAPADIRAALGPGIGRCCYEVGPEVVAAVAAVTPLPPADLCDPLPGGKARLDLWAANTAHLVEAGLAAERITGPRLCTGCHVDRFFSHRREGAPAGRGGAVIALLP